AGPGAAGLTGGRAGQLSAAGRRPAAPRGGVPGRRRRTGAGSSGGGPPRRAATGGGIDVSTRRCPPAGGNRPFGAGPGRVGMDGGPAPAGAAGACGHAGPGGCGPAGPGPGGAGLAGGHLGVPKPLAGTADPAGRRGLERPQRGVRDVGRKKWWWALAVAAVVIAAAAFTGLGERVASRLAGGRVQEAGVADLPTITVRQGD